MRAFIFALRNGKEMLRDKLNLAFGIGFPLVLLLLLTMIQRNIPVELFDLPQLTPGVVVFGLSFISLFSGMLIAKDRVSSFMLRLYASPLRAVDFIVGYTLPLLPMALAQTLVCYGAACLLGLPLSWRLLPAVLCSLPAGLLYIAIGLLCGSVFTDKQVGGICGALLTNLSAWLSGTWFDVGLVGGSFETIAQVLPFSHCVELGRAALSGEMENIGLHLLVVLGYAVGIFAVSVLVFTRKMRAS